MQFGDSVQYGIGDEYFITVSVEGYKPATATVKADPSVHQTISFLLIPENVKLVFPSWPELKAQRPQIAKLISGEDTDDIGGEALRRDSKAQTSGIGVVLQSVQRDG